MSEFIQEIKDEVKSMVDSVMNESTVASDFVVIYAGRFQPFHRSHYDVYRSLVKKFGKNKVYIGTSNKTDATSSPFSFDEKKKIITTMFGVDASRIVQVKNPYRPVEITNKFDETKTAFITVVGQKDAQRLSGKYFKPYTDNTPMAPMTDNGYVYTIPHITNVFKLPGGSKDVSGTVVRNALKLGTDKEKQDVFTTLYPKMDKKIFNLVTSKLSEQVTEDDIVHFLSKVDLFKLLSEGSTSDSAGASQSVDDGPRYHYPSFGIYQRVTARRAAKIGYSVIDYVINGAGPQGEMAPDYPDGPVDAVSFLPAGVAGARTPTNQEDLVGSAGWNKWFDHVTRAATLVGYELVKSKEERIRQDKERKQTSKQSKADDNVKFNLNVVSESTSPIFRMLREAINEFNLTSDIIEYACDVTDDDKSVIEHLVDFTLAELNITEPPMIRLTNEREDISTTAYYNTQTYEIKVYTKNRALADVLRSVVHEIVHHQQNLENRLVRNEKSEWAIGETDPLETEAHAMAGHIITKFKHISEKNIYINEVLNKKYDYACLMAATEFPMTVNVDENDVYDEPGFGIENEPHVTILYGLHEEVTFDDVLKVIGNVGEFNIKYTGIGLFENEQYDVLKFNVQSDVLEQLNSKVKSALPYTSNYTEYHAHQTIAYLKPGMGKKYVKEFDNPISGVVRTLYYSHPTAEKEYFQLNKNLIMEGGAYGHMAHPFEDMELTFGDLKTLITTALQGKLERVSEKLDGQNIMVSWKNGKLIFARNKSHIKGFGKNALDLRGIQSMFSGRGSLSDAFSHAAEDLSNAISKLSEKQKNIIFGEGRYFMNLEIIFVQNLNTIPYDSNILVFHGSIEYDEDGNPINQPKESGRILAGMIKQINQDVQKTFNISGPVVSELPPVKDFSSSQRKYLSKVTTLQSKFKLKDTDEVALYHQKWWEDFVEKNAAKFNVTLSDKTRIGLVKRWAFNDKSFRLNSSFISDKKFLEWAISFDKKDQDQVRRRNMLPFELLFLELGAEVLQNYASPLIIAKDKATQDLKKELSSAANELRKTKDIAKLDRFKRALEKLRAIGGMKTVVPTEGIVFNYKGNVYKLTGSFASANQIIGLLKY